MFEDMALSKGYRNTRLYTDAVDNEAAIAFYTANGYTSELYDNPYDPVCRQIKTLIFSKSLTQDFVDPWHNRNIHLSEQIAKQGQNEE
jgi:ribosomal protein S18 acetylase RimI-like enzyme